MAVVVKSFKHTSETVGADKVAAHCLLVDSSGVGVSGSTPTATLANVSASATSVTLQAANTARKGWFVYNDSTAVLYVKFGATASATSFTVAVPPATLFEMPLPVYGGVIDGIWASAVGAARVTEL